MKNTQNRTKKTDWVDTHVYLRKDQLKRLKADAQQTGRTLQGMIRWMLDEQFKQMDVVAQLDYKIVADTPKAR